MAPAQSKDTNSKITSCSDSRHSKNQIMAKPNPKGSSIGSLSNLSMKQIVAVVAPDKDKGIFFNCTKDASVDVDLGMTGTGLDVTVDLTNDVDLTKDGTEAGSKGGMTDDGSVSNGKGMNDGLTNDGSISTGRTETTEGMETKGTKVSIEGTEMMDSTNGTIVTYLTGAEAETCW